jgi:protein SCO1
VNCMALFLPLLLAAVLSAQSIQCYDVTGLVLSVDAPHRTVLCRTTGFQDTWTMTMPYRVDNARVLDSIKPGDKIEFTLIVSKTSSYISNVHVHEYDNLERDPTQARRLKILDEAMRSKAGSPSTLSPGQTVPDFSLVDQKNHPMTLAEFRGKVVAITFIYTRCPLPDYCMRLSNVCACRTTSPVSRSVSTIAWAGT